MRTTETPVRALLSTTVFFEGTSGFSQAGQLEIALPAGDPDARSLLLSTRGSDAYSAAVNRILTRLGLFAEGELAQHLARATEELRAAEVADGTTLLRFVLRRISVTDFPWSVHATGDEVDFDFGGTTPIEQSTEWDISVCLAASPVSGTAPIPARADYLDRSSIREDDATARRACSELDEEQLFLVQWLVTPSTIALPVRFRAEVGRQRSALVRTTGGTSDHIRGALAILATALFVPVGGFMLLRHKAMLSEATRRACRSIIVGLALIAASLANIFLASGPFGDSADAFLITSIVQIAIAICVVCAFAYWGWRAVHWRNAWLMPLVGAVCLAAALSLAYLNVRGSLPLVPNPDTSGVFGFGLVVALTAAAMAVTGLVAWLGIGLGLVTPTAPRAFVVAARLALAALIVAVGTQAVVNAVVATDREGETFAILFENAALDLGDAAVRLAFYPIALESILVSFVPVIALLAVAFALRDLAARSPSAFVTPDQNARWLIVLMFAAFVTGTSGTIGGFRIPLPFLFTLLVAPLLLRDSLKKALEDLATRNSASDATRLVQRSKVELLRRTKALANLRRRQAHLWSEFVASPPEASFYYRDYGETVAEAQRLESGSRLSKPDSPYEIDVPVTLRMRRGWTPPRLALAFGPEQDWWGNGVRAVLLGGCIAALPFAFAVGSLFAARGDIELSTGAPIGILNLGQAMLYEAAFWLVAAFALGAFFTRLPGWLGVMKGASLWLFFAVPNVVATWLLPGRPTDWVFRALELLLFLAVTGVALDWWTLKKEKIDTRQLSDHYQIKDVRVLLGYLSPVVLTIIGLLLQIQSGNAQDAVTDLLKGIPNFVPMQPGGG